MSKKQHKLKSDVQDLLALAKKKQVDQIEISAVLEKGFSVSARMGDVDTLEHHQSNSFSVTVYQHKRTGSAHTSDLSKAALLTALDKACAIAQHTNEDPFSGLAEESLMAFGYPDLDLYHPWDIDPKTAIPMVINCETLARQYDPRITRSEEATINTFSTFEIYANSHEFLGHYSSTVHGLNCSVVAEQEGHMQRDHDYTMAHDPRKLLSVEAIANQVGAKTIRRLGSKALTTRQCPVIFHAPVAKSLLRAFVAAISGSNLYRGTTFLRDCLGKSIFPDSITIYQDPHLLNEIGSAPFDSEGVRTRKINYIEKGMLANYVLSSYSARKLGMQTTGNAGGVHNLFITDSNKSFPDLLKTMGTGLLITELMGQGVNIMTGDYSRGAFGYWVENGEIQYPVEEITIAGNLKDMFQKTSLVANDVDRRGNIKTGSLLIEKMTVAGK